MAEVSKEELEKALRFVYRRHQKEPGILHKSLFLDELAMGLRAEVGLAKIDAEEYVDNFFHKYKNTKLFTEKFSFNNLAEAGIDVTKATIGEELSQSIKKGAEFANEAITDKEKVDNAFNEIVANFDNSDENVVDFREKQLQKLMEEVEAATPDVTKITSSQAEMIDNALADAAANLRRGTFEALPGGKGALTKAIKTRLVSLLGDGLNVLDVYELGLLLGAVGQPAIEPIVKLIFPDVPDDNRPYKERVLENIQRVEKISPTAKAVKKISEAMPEPDDTEYTIYGVPSNRAVQFTSMYGMLGGNNGEK